MPKIIVDKDVIDFIFESEYNRKLFSKYLRAYFHELGDKFWSKYYVHFYHSLNPLTNSVNEKTYTFSFHKISGSNYKSPIVHFNQDGNRIQISSAFNKMQHYECKPIECSDIQIMFKNWRRERSIDILLNENIK